MSEINRREFVERAAAAAGALAMGAAADAETDARPQCGAEHVKLGKTGIRASLVGVGTGSVGWNHASNQTRLGQEGFNAVIHHAYDSGITFFDSADQYGSHAYLREALKPIPREKYVLQTKTNSVTAADVRADIERFRKELGVDYIDIVLLHCMEAPDWNVRLQGAKDILEEARQKGVIRAHGCSCHTIEALEAAASDPWVQVDLARFNPWSKYMDAAPERVRSVLQRMRAAGKGVIGMKILAQGDRAKGPDRLENARASVQHAMSPRAVDMMIVGFESPEQVSEVLQQTKLALAQIDRIEA